MGGIYILPQFRGLQLAGDLVSFLVETAKKLQVPNVYCLPFEELENFIRNMAILRSILRKKLFIQLF